MNFSATPTNVTTLLVVALGVVAANFLFKRRFDSNLSLFFYLIVLVYQNWSDRHVSNYLYTVGLVLALLLRFEFMNSKITKVCLVLELLALGLICLTYLGQAFNVETGF